MRRRDAGLSLAEVLVSLVILSMVGLASVVLLTTLIRTDEALEQRGAAFEELDQAMALIGNTLLNGAPGSLEVMPDSIAFDLVPEMGGHRVTFLLSGGVLTRELSQDGAGLVQTLAQELRVGTWHVEDGGLIEMTLEFSGLSGTRVFRAP